MFDLIKTEKMMVETSMFRIHTSTPQGKKQQFVASWYDPASGERAHRSLC